MKQQSLGSFPAARADTEQVIPVQVPYSDPSGTAFHHLLEAFSKKFNSTNFWMTGEDEEQLILC